MKKLDGRRRNDNSRVYHIERVENIKNAVQDICERVKKSGEPRTFAHVAKTMQEFYKKPIVVSAQTLRENEAYRKIFDAILKDEFDMPEINIRKNNPKSNAELRNEVHKEKTKVQSLKSEIKIMKHQIRQSNITVSDVHVHDAPDITMINQLEMSNKTLLEFMQELGKLGDFFWDREGFKRASDGKLFLTQKAMLLMGVEPKQLPMIPASGSWKNDTR